MPTTPPPTQHPDWATGSDNVVEPPAGKVTVGWVPGEQPPSGWFNWWKNLVGVWTRWLEAQVGSLETRIGTVEPIAADAARKSVANTFATGQIINVPDSTVDWPILTTDDRPGDYEGSMPDGADPSTNRWKLEIQLPTSPTSWAGIFVGQPPDGTALVNNARWHPATQRWRQLDDTRDSYGFIGIGGQYTMSIKPAGSPPWFNWPNDQGGDLIAAGSIQANGAGSGHILAHGLFKYTPEPSRPIQINLSYAQPYGVPGSGVTFLGSTITLSPGKGVSIPFRPPHGGTLGQCRVKVQCAGAFSYGFRGYRLYDINMADTTTPPNVAAVGGDDTALAGISNLVADYAGLTASKDEQYWLLVQNGGASAFSIDVLAAEYVLATDPGPRNH